MIFLEHVSKHFHHEGQTKTIARDISFCFPQGERVGLLGRNGAGKSTVLKMLSGRILPDQGRIQRTGSISWPVGFAGFFHNDLTGGQNARFIARVYGLNPHDVTEACEEFAGLGSQMNWPVSTYSSGMKSRLAFAVSMAVPFDTYLIDEITAVGDQAFRVRCEEMLKSHLKNRSAVIVSHSPEILQNLCTSAVVLENGRFFYYAKVSKALEHYQHLMAGRLPPWMC